MKEKGKGGGEMKGKVIFCFANMKKHRSRGVRQCLETMPGKEAVSTTEPQ